MSKQNNDSAIPDWKQKLSDIKNKDINTVVDYEKQFKFNHTEVGMRNLKNQSHLKIFDNGNVEMFAGDASGITINDTYDTVNIFGNATNINTHNMNILTRPYGLSWNGYILNPQLYQLHDEDFRLNGSVKQWIEATDEVPAHWTRRSISIRPFNKASVNDEFNSILSELGIPI